MPFDARHCASAAALVNRFIRETTVHFAEREQSEAEWFDELRKKDERPWLAAEDGADICSGASSGFLGFAKAGSWRAREAYRYTAEVAVYVEHAARRRGVARSLYLGLFDELRKLGCHTVAAGITLPNEASAAFHEAMGFRHVGVFREVGWKFDAWRDVGFWQRHL